MNAGRLGWQIDFFDRLGAAGRAAGADADAVNAAR